MPIHFDFDPLTGMTETFDYDPISDRIAISYSQDVSGFLDRLQALRNDPEYSKRGIKEEWWHYASIPPVVEIALRNKGLSLYNKDHHAAIFKEINANFPYLKTTEKTHQ